MYGPTSKLIVLASRYTPALLEARNNDIPFWRYEIWWTHSKKARIDSMRVVELEEDGGIYRRLFEDKIQELKREKEEKKWRLTWQKKTKYR